MSQSNVPITAGSGTQIAADLVSSNYYQQVKLTDGTLGSTNAAVVTAQGDLKTTSGGSSYLTGAAASASAQVKTGAGRIARLFITSAGTAALSLYDNTAATGNPLFTTPATTTAGSIYALDIPFGTGLYVSAGANTPGYTITYS